MPFPGLVDEVKAQAPKLRGRLTADAPVAEATWFRVGGPAEALFSPADEDDLAYVLSALPREIPVTPIGLGSNLIVRDGGIAGLVIRLGGRAFGAVEIMDGARVVVGAATPDQYIAKAAAIAGVDGLAFLRGVPGSIGGRPSGSLVCPDGMIGACPDSIRVTSVLAGAGTWLAIQVAATVVVASCR